MMRSRILAVGLLAYAVAAGMAAAQSSPPAGAAPTLDELRRAVDNLPAGRVERPESYDSMTAEQRRYLEGILSGPRNAVSGPIAPRAGE